MHAARDLAAMGMAKQIVDAGGAVVQILAGASMGQLSAWITASKVTYTIVRDPDGMGSQTLKALVRREYCYLVDLSTMKILKVYIGSTDGNEKMTTIAIALPDILQLLAQ